MMKTSNIISLWVVLLMALCGCSKGNTTSQPTAPIRLSTSTAALKVGESHTVTLRGGDGTFRIASSPTIVSCELKGSSLVLTAKEAGEGTIVIRSADQTAELKVTISAPPAPLPDLMSKPGVYGEDGQPLFGYALTASTKGGVWLCAKAGDPYHSRLFLPYLSGKHNPGDAVSLKIIVEGTVASSLPDTGGKEKEYALEVKKTDPKFAYLFDPESRVYFVVTLK